MQSLPVWLQVWLGCLYLCDFITDNYHIFRNATVVELGAGVGLASIVASIYAHQVFCTGNSSILLVLLFIKTSDLILLIYSLPLYMTMCLYIICVCVCTYVYVHAYVSMR